MAPKEVKSDRCKRGRKLRDIISYHIKNEGPWSHGARVIQDHEEEPALHVEQLMKSVVQLPQLKDRATKWQTFVGASWRQVPELLSGSQCQERSKYSFSIVTSEQDSSGIPLKHV